MTGITKPISLEPYPYVVQARQVWLRARDVGLCEPFSDEELEVAERTCKPIKRGWVAGCGLRMVDMWVDPRFPTLAGGSDATDA